MPVLFGFEESYGYLAGGFSRDKDAVCASMLVCDAAAWYMRQGKTLYDVMEEIYRKYGFYMEKVKSYTLSGKEGMEKIANAMAKLREDPIRSIGGASVEYYEDHKKQEKLCIPTGETCPTGLPAANALRYLLPGGAWAVVRPSGTEPKLKLYIGSVGATAEDGEEKLGLMMNELDALISELLK